ncbi:hypothetical protein [Actinokineospora enzanensis]|uniref:hypothetical protein n=1 Tax=Actinokineospora enzanensis TaxID=155975 RepID=UPI00039C3AD2|nr:hypothetical protein [Actinokineospora enzanensis]
MRTSLCGTPLSSTMMVFLVATALSLSACGHENSDAIVITSTTPTPRTTTTTTEPPPAAPATTPESSAAVTTIRGTSTARTARAGGSTRTSGPAKATRTTTAALPPKSDTEVPRAPATGAFTVTISGTVSGNSFRRTGTLRVVSTITTTGTTNGVNPVDVCLISGFPAGQPEVGAIRFGSNSGCYPSTSAKLDMATVSANGNTYTVAPDERMAATGSNNFTASSDYIFACPFFPVSGQLRLTLDRGVQGAIDITGYGGASCGSSHYQATISA